jgi:hypothetical protein
MKYNSRSDTESENANQNKAKDASQYGFTTLQICDMVAK